MHSLTVMLGTEVKCIYHRLNTLGRKQAWHSPIKMWTTKTNCDEKCIQMKLQQLIWNIEKKCFWQSFLQKLINFTISNCEQYELTVEMRS